ncbi:hypothetical protein H0A36_20000 [Endozoicomonas sp. SM1973]|uniref:ATPase n=1 Tax=Spartinivicinus marinus TaxID=2994442 RepID=A0A853I4L4_9GAMM|nr:hypothetical protein [Spartinivicinus marinus]MCX4025675.1 hypothetical protein [Spartinivicinus marinus]NYZ68303.1 hypothetical protein [Spartinivicinus marinus]
MQFPKLHDVLDYVVKTHWQMSQLYQKLSHKAEQEKVKLLLDYLVEHEKAISDYLIKIEEHTPSQVINLWYQELTNDPLFRQYHAKDFDKDISLNDVMQIALELDDRLIDLYQLLASHAKSHQAKETLNNLLYLEKQRKKQFLLNALQLNID